MQASITLKAGKERPLLRRHPWVYSNAIERVDGKIYPGATVQCCRMRASSLRKAFTAQHRKSEFEC
jgi:23S rRNA G2069 N7-methylase RlmK/C1962 C5-methylase RlmI